MSRLQQRCGDLYGYGEWTQDHPRYKDMPDEKGFRAYAEWLKRQPPCGHKTHVSRRAKWIERYGE